MDLVEVIHHERAGTTIFQFLGDMSYVGLLSMTSKTLLAAMMNMVKRGRQHTGHKQITFTGYPSDILAVTSVQSWSVSLHSILKWLVDCKVVLRVANGSYDDPENLYKYLPQHVYPCCTELVIQTKYIYRFDGISDTFPNVQHLTLDLRRERDATVDITELTQLTKNFKPLLSLSISAPEVEQIVGLDQLSVLTSLQKLSFYNMEWIDLQELQKAMKDMKLLEELEVYTELTGINQVLDLSRHKSLRLVGLQNVFLVPNGEAQHGMKLRFVPPQHLSTLVCVTSEGSTRGRKGPTSALHDQLLASGVDVHHYDHWQEVYPST